MAGPPNRDGFRLRPSPMQPLDAGREVIARLSLRLPSEPRSAGEARRALDSLEGGVEQTLVARTRLLLTELVTNSIRHAGGDSVHVEIAVFGDRIRVGVHDEGPGFEPARVRRDGVTGGWGLVLVRRMSDRWGVGEGGSRVWFEIDRGD